MAEVAVEPLGSIELGAEVEVVEEDSGSLILDTVFFNSTDVDQDEAPSEDEIIFTRMDPSWQNDLTISSSVRVSDSWQQPPTQRQINSKSTSHRRFSSQSERKHKKKLLQLSSVANLLRSKEQVFPNKKKSCVVVEDETESPIQTNNCSVSKKELEREFLQKGIKTFVCGLCQQECLGWNLAADHTAIHQSP